MVEEKVEARMGIKRNRKSVKGKLGQKYSRIKCTRDFEDPRKYALGNPGVCLKAFGRVTVESILLKQVFLRETKMDDSTAVVWQLEK